MKNLFNGEQVRLTAVKVKDVDTIEKWYNDMEFMRNFDSFLAKPLNGSEIEKIIQEYNNSNTSMIFAIRPINSDEIIGVTGFESIQWNNGNATIFIGIGNKQNRGKGIGKEALRLTIDYGFNEMGLHRIQLNVLSYNEAAIKLYEGIGFKKEGVLREFILRDRRRYDLIYYGLINHEYISN